MNETNWKRVQAIYERALELDDMGYHDDAKKKYHEAYALLSYELDKLNSEQLSLYRIIYSKIT